MSALLLKLKERDLISDAIECNTRAHIWNVPDQLIFPLRTDKYRVSNQENGSPVEIGEFDIFQYLTHLSDCMVTFVENEYRFNCWKASVLYNKNRLPITSLTHKQMLDALTKCRTAHKRFIRQIVFYQLKMYFETEDYGYQCKWGDVFVNDWRNASGSRFAYNLPPNYQSAHTWNSKKRSGNYHYLSLTDNSFQIFDQPLVSEPMEIIYGNMHIEKSPLGLDQNGKLFLFIFNLIYFSNCIQVFFTVTSNIFEDV
jgi:hypothetical protein